MDNADIESYAHSAVKADILIVDDAPANLRLLSNMLAEQGYRVRPVPEGQLALAAAQAEPPDLILLDIMMPEMSGFEVCKNLKDDSRTGDIPIIFISALDDVQDKVEAFRLGGVDYITKPFQFEEILARVESHLALRRLQQQLEEVHKKMKGELALAGEVQANFLPRKLPEIPGWQFAATLKSANMTSGDFYDLFYLPNGSLGILAADVVDQGVGAALFMVLSWSLLRSYAAKYPSEPARVLKEVNQRILAEAGDQQLVTVFYGVLSPTSGELVYCSAAHPTAYLLDTPGKQIQELKPGGPLVGGLNQGSWEQSVIQFNPGSTLVLYTDGITQALNTYGTPYGQGKLIDSIKAHQGNPAQEFQEGLLADISAFMGETQQIDDITIVVLRQLQPD